ncbi:MAG: ankyrin repeat domain-containing protein [Rhodobacteraceae bacterium]|nr:ankyrin repeat domain-containing protein [Paracoccaceae bacterium]
MFRMTLAALMLTSAVSAQTAPSTAEIAAYKGLFRAAHEGDVQGIGRLLDGGADIDARDSKGRAAIHVAAFASHDDALRALAEAGADMNALEGRAYDVVTIAAVADDPELMSLAIDLGNDPGLVTSPYDGTALIAAGAPLDHVNNLHWTAVMEAVVLGDGGRDHQAVLAALLDAGADRGLADRDGVTPLQHARARGYAEMAERLERAD